MKHAVLDGETCCTGPRVASGWSNSVPTEDLPQRQHWGAMLHLLSVSTRSLLEPGLLVEGRDWPQFNTTAQQASS